MKKSLVALAALSAMSAFADVDVSGGIKMYGVLDQALISQKWVGLYASDPIAAQTPKSASNVGLFAAGATSRLGVKGARDLGDGIKGVVQIEIELSPDTQAGQGGVLPTKNRGTFVGLEKSDVGFIRLGTQETTAYETFAMDVNGRVEYKPQVWRYTAADNQQDRAGNAIKLSTAAFMGVTASAMYARSDTASNNAGEAASGSTAPGSASAGDFKSLGLKYQQGDVQLAYVWDVLTNTANAYQLPGQMYEGPGNNFSGNKSQKGKAITIASAGDIERQIGAASYTFGDFKLNAIKADANTSGKGSIKTTTFGVRYTYDKFAIAYSIGAGKVKNLGTGSTNSGDVSDNTVGAYYNFDKSTSVYFLGSQAKYKPDGKATSSTSTQAIGVQYRF